MPVTDDPSGRKDARLALLYLEAARRVLGPKHPGAMPEVEMMSGPVSFLIAHAVELGLGALLRSSRSRSRKPNHDLEDRMSRVEKLGFTVPERFRTYVRLINPAHKLGQFRYARANERAFVDGQQALDIVTPVLKEVESHLARGRPAAS